MQASNKFEDLVEIVKILRKECPWDRKQTHQSIKDNLIEEAYEAVEAIDQEDFEELKKELGDLLLHVVFHSRMADETEDFKIDDVIFSIQEKLIRRHPHVFGDTEALDEQQVAENWEAIKLKEGKDSVLDGLPAHLPALIKAQRMQEKAANVGFDWPEWRQVWEKLEEELGEFKEVLEEENQQKSKEEFGDLLFSLVNVGRFFNLNAEDSLRMTNNKFIRRFRYIERQIQESDRSLNDVSLEEMDGFWEEAKTKA
ncbi:nucleoside triphosphate pyrophosphohydrolase [Balneolaceae bacterium YR4-1]|uniref:Nucleoside triphosphate pyrophosphohydrolase n=1 Tax=Halalkalibaculum roseum TaxID=2709311 RepID=A0A6M1T287_9BACT|nr:nucleoside triphosphate pyrophosphohydrolase [Halalkalibaculum roseum]NGP76145.1 nucleoside triphosphate pyrophosphohydrolase [Halalkalibaculum roseum]